MSVSELAPIERRDYPLAVNEIFGPVWQGEGPSLGRVCMFVRLAGCNLHCSWCDTPYTWDWKKYSVREESHAMTVQHIVEKLSMTALAAPMFVISGGEPLLQDKGIEALIKEYKELFPSEHSRWEIETNGTEIPCFSSELVDQFNVSPKLSGSGNEPKEAFCPDVLNWFVRTNRAVFKFVVSDSKELTEVNQIRHWCSIPRERIWIMAEGMDYPEVVDNMRTIAPYVSAMGFNLTTRLHILLYGNRRGV